MPSKRLALAIATARKNPEFAARMLQNLAPEARDFVLAELSKRAHAEARSFTHPRVRKCRPQPAVSGNNGMSAQLNLFARGVSRVA